jgi:hypothetical protein
MKSRNKLAIVGLLWVVGTSFPLLGQDMTATNSESWWDRSPLYHDQELSLDGFGLGTVGQHTLDRFTGERFVHHVRLGVGAGANFFFMRYFGVGAEASSESTHHSFINDVAGNLIFRVPVADTGLAPYGFVGGGKEFEPFIQWEGHLGAGLEFRFCPHFSVFIDGRYVFAQTSQNYGMGRAGLRVTF